MLETTIKKIPTKVLKQYHKRFALGEQYISITPDGKIVQESPSYYWQPKEVYNKILPLIISHSCCHLTEDDLYGRNGLVSLLIPYQRTYNQIMNSHNAHLEFATYGFLSVEDGSVYTDDIETNGLMPGKMIVYRQGAIEPKFLKDSINVQPYIESAEYCYGQMISIVDSFLHSRQRGIKGE